VPWRLECSDSTSGADRTLGIPTMKGNDMDLGINIKAKGKIEYMVAVFVDGRCVLLKDEFGETVA